MGQFAVIPLIVMNGRRELKELELVVVWSFGFFVMPVVKLAILRNLTVR